MGDFCLCVRSVIILNRDFRIGVYIGKIKYLSGYQNSLNSSHLDSHKFEWFGRIAGAGSVEFD